MHVSSINLVVDISIRVFFSLLLSLSSFEQLPNCSLRGQVDVSSYNSPRSKVANRASILSSRGRYYQPVEAIHVQGSASRMHKLCIHTGLNCVQRSPWQKNGKRECVCALERVTRGIVDNSMHVCTIDTSVSGVFFDNILERNPLLACNVT